MVHNKDKKISILALNTLTDEYGQPLTDELGQEIQEWIPLPGLDNIWAYYRQLSGSEFWAAHRENVKEEVLFEINWREDLDTRSRVEFRGKQYGITRIDNFEGNKQDLRIYAFMVE